MAKYNVSLEQITAKLIEVAAKQPRKVYGTAGRNCQYFPTRNKVTHRKDRCIFGQTFFELGVSDEDLRTCGRHLTAAFLDLFDIHLSRGILDEFNRVQTAQDSGKSWGEAIKLGNFGQGK